MRQNIFRCLMAAGLLSLIFLSSVAHANIVIKVRALNPLENEETASIYYPLPKEVTPSDIVEKKITFSFPAEEGEEKKTTFNVEYVPEKGNYYIVDDVLLGPREVVTLEVHVRDIWSIPPERLSGLKKTVEDLIARTEPPPDGEGPNETAMALQEEIFKQFDEIGASQADSSILKVGVEKHMEAYYENIDALGQLRADIGMLRFLLEPPEPEEEGEEGAEGEQVAETGESAETAQEEDGLELPPDLEMPEEEVPVPAAVDAAPDEEEPGTGK